MRLFAALWLPAEMAAPIESHQDTLQTLGWQGRFVNPADAHVTIKFYGDVPAADLPALERRLAQAAATASPIALQFGAWGAFGRTDEPHTVFLGTSPPPALLQLARAVRGEVAANWTPHVTLLRVRQPGSQLPDTPGTLVWQAGSIRLAESRPGPSGAQYRTVREYPLTGGNDR